LIDDVHVAQGAGELTMIALAWFEPGNVDPDYRVGKDPELWGSLFGSLVLRPPPSGSQTAARWLEASWVKGGPICFTTDDDDRHAPPSSKGTGCVLPTLIIADIGAGIGSNMQIASRACAAHQLSMKVGMTVKPDETLLRGPKGRKNPLYASVEELDPISTSFEALHILNVSLPCAANRVNLLNQHTGWCLLDSRVMCMIAMASLVVCAQKALVKLENTRGFATSPVCQLMRALVHASGGHSVLWIGTASDQALPVNGTRTHLLMGNAESKHLLIDIESALKRAELLWSVCCSLRCLVEQGMRSRYVPSWSWFLTRFSTVARVTVPGGWVGLPGMGLLSRWYTVHAFLTMWLPGLELLIRPWA
jgi:hypothetical protein